ncbi:hypothetical protein NAEGRDRAFT_57038 [Naegleria gruberi]|uniref:Uncharacterized protein n=1 Tax=Naegleria gruberi TaxID=5762 RepID=D2V3U9_NAEGR|nr:uncharacterized protein NAEGRDRAFT_57038 [Naegleria gruberi]EFC48419.1 hypothetical protein NAEGRDRAFT_57038 [Naegleria gruberi]|eukprot:XP_002681163.1 hypothetical protein NAEGRDRAFT_57038 [Naegleria gruberi strain NEG-M]
MSKHTILPVAILAVEIPTSRNIMASFAHSVSSSISTNPLSPSSPALIRKVSITSPSSPMSSSPVPYPLSPSKSNLSSSSSSNSLSNMSSPKPLDKVSLDKPQLQEDDGSTNNGNEIEDDEDDALTSSSNYSSGSSSTNSLSESTLQAYQQQQQMAINLGKLRNSNSPLLDELRERFLAYLEKHQDSATSHEMRVKIMFLGKFLNPSTMKVKSAFERHQELINRVIEEFCHDLAIECDLTDTKKQSAELSISTLQKNGLDSVPFLVKIVKHIQVSNEKKSTLKKLFVHERLGQFLTRQHENIEKNLTPHLFTDLENKSLGMGIIDELQVISQMFLYELEDWFLLFQDHSHKFVEKWLAQSVDSSSSKIPKMAIDIILKKRELFRQAEKELKLSSEDLALKYVIDRDWKFVNFLTKEFMPDWYLTYKKQSGELIQWCTKSDFSVDKLGAKTMKMIGKIEISLENSVNALHYDDHLQFILKNIVYHEYGKIDTSSSKSKYALANMSSDFEPTSFMPKRALEMVLSSQASFVGGEMMDCMCLMKSCDNVLAGDLAERERVRVPLVGSRFLQKLDNNRTRYIELKMLNMVGILNTQLVWNVACKKLAVLNHNGLLAALKRAELTDYQMPPLSKNQTMRTLYDNCKQQLGIDVSEVLFKKTM